jgi:hypothetical protein
MRAILDAAARGIRGRGSDCLGLLRRRANRSRLGGGFVPNCIAAVTNGPIHRRCDLKSVVPLDASPAAIAHKAHPTAGALRRLGRATEHELLVLTQERRIFDGSVVM